MLEILAAWPVLACFPKIRNERTETDREVEATFLVFPFAALVKCVFSFHYASQIK